MGPGLGLTGGRRRGLAQVGGSTFVGLSDGIAVYPSLASIPEPSSLVLLALGTVGLAMSTRRRGPRRVS
jgi:hypothetical protein